MQHKQSFLPKEWCAGIGIAKEVNGLEEIEICLNICKTHYIATVSGKMTYLQFSVF